MFICGSALWLMFDHTSFRGGPTKKNNERHKKENLQFSLSFSSKFLIVSTHLVRVIKKEILFLLFVSSFLFLLSDKKQMCCVKWCVPDARWWVRRVSFSYFDSCFHFHFLWGTCRVSVTEKRHFVIEYVVNEVCFDFITKMSC